MTRNVRYPKEMRALAKAKGLALLTIDTPGMTYQTPATEEQVSDLRKLFRKWVKQKPKQTVR